MKNIFKTKNIIILFYLLFLSVNSNALTVCPVQGLDKKVCSIVVDFFDELAKHNSEFAKHWQNHHWVSQAGDNYKPQISISEHMLMSFSERQTSKDLTTFINSVLTRASQKDPSFQQVLDSHNFFIMTVQAMHLELQKGADRFNKSGAPMISLRGHNPEETDLKLNYVYDVEVPTTDKGLNSLGIYSLTQHRYIHSTYIDSTTYKAGIKVNPIVVSSLNPVFQKPMKVSGKSNNLNNQKSISGTIGKSSSTTHNVPNTSNTVNSISKNPIMAMNKGTSGSIATNVPTPKPQVNTNIAPPIVYTYNIPKPMKVSGKSNNLNNKSKIVLSVKKKGSTLPPKVVLKKIDNTKNTHINTLLTNPTKWITHTKPSKTVIQVVPKGIDKGNVNNRLITQVAGSQTKNNSRHYIMDNNSKVWACKVSSLGYRVTPDFDGEMQSFGHVETTHIKSTQFSHIPSNHASGNTCLISVSK